MMGKTYSPPSIHYDPVSLGLRTLMGALNISQVELLQNSRTPEEMIDLMTAKLDAFVEKAIKNREVA